MPSHPSGVDERAQPPVERIPDRYRELLDELRALELGELRREAAVLRRSAARAYSRAWDDRCSRELEEVARRVALVARTRREGSPARPRRSDRAVALLGRLPVSPTLAWGRWLSARPN
jgi:hypothetical protein